LNQLVEDRFADPFVFLEFEWHGPVLRGDGLGGIQKQVSTSALNEPTDQFLKSGMADVITQGNLPISIFNVAINS
jgi:hypothetical protein